MESTVALFRYRWDAPVLAELAAGRGCKYVTLRHRLGVADVPLRQSLDWLIDCGWVMRNPGYGHPSRPEYILTADGLELAHRCTETLAALHAADALQIGLNRWSVPVLAALLKGSARFAELRRALPDVTPRALTQTLRELTEAGLAAREVVGEMPVRVAYSVSEAGAAVARIWVG